MGARRGGAAIAARARHGHSIGLTRSGESTGVPSRTSRSTAASSPLSAASRSCSRSAADARAAGALTSSPLSSIS
jgi:hypothetical protein